MKRYIAFVAALFLFAAANAQTQQQYTGQYTPSTPSDLLDCGEFLWPPVAAGQTQFLPPCPRETVKIKQRWDHTPYPQYREMGWDTAVTCSSRQITLSCTPYIPVQYFNGQYFVDQIPFDPADTSFHAGTRLPNGADDIFCATQTLPPCAAMPEELDTFYFYFFGKLKRTFAAGGNGILSFKNGAGGQFCAFGDWSPLPWDSLASSKPSTYHFDAIYGVFQDTYPNAYCDPPYGIYYSIQGEYPCRKIIASYNHLPLYPGSSYHSDNDRCTYQIVCYEASNIIEIHIKHRGINTSWKNANGIIGIQNGSGKPQKTGALGTDTMEVWKNAPAAFYPNTPASIFQGGGNGLSRKYIDNVAYRFTPNGNTQYNSKWYRILDDGTNVELTTDQNDTNGYYIPMQQDMNVWLRDYPNCPTLTRAVVSPKRVSRYMYRLKFQNAAGHWYDLSDTITVGVDTANTMALRASGQPEDSRLYNICKTYQGDLLYEYPSVQDTLYTTRRLYRIQNGAEVDLPITNITFGEQRDDGTVKRMPITIPDDFNEEGVPLNKIDSIRFYMFTKFISGCTNSDEIAVDIYPNYDTTQHFTICQGEHFTWTANGQTYTTTTQTSKKLTSITGCDSLVHLDLVVLNVSNTTDNISDCKPITWQNGRTYTTDNSTDTVMLKNQWDCDSIVHLNFTIHPLTAKLKSSLDYFDLDHLDVELYDLSTGNDSRTWKFPNGTTATGPTAYYTLPITLDTAKIWLYAHSPYGCEDSALAVIPFNKETFWVPNVFTPGDPSGNNKFSAFSTKTVKHEMQIFDRRGEMVFHCEGVDCEWDGRDMNGNDCPQGAYVYLIRYTNEYGIHQAQILRGTVTLLR